MIFDSNVHKYENSNEKKTCLTVVPRGQQEPPHGVERRSSATWFCHHHHDYRGHHRHEYCFHPHQQHQHQPEPPLGMGSRAVMLSSSWLSLTSSWAWLSSSSQGMGSQSTPTSGNIPFIIIICVSPWTWQIWEPLVKQTLPHVLEWGGRSESLGFSYQWPIWPEGGWKRKRGKMERNKKMLQNLFRTCCSCSRPVPVDQNHFTWNNIHVNSNDVQALHWW